MEDTHLASHLCGGTEDRQTEGLFINRLRAGEGEEDTSRTNHLDGLGIDALVATEGILDRIAVLGESRRIEDDEIVRLTVFFLLAQIVKRVCGNGLMVRCSGNYALH